MTERDHPPAPARLLDETDVDRAISEEDATDWGAMTEPFAPSEPAGADVDADADANAPTTDDLEQQLEGGMPGSEEQALHPEDAAVEVLDDEREATAADMSGEAGEELEWRMADQRSDETVVRD